MPYRLAPCDLGDPGWGIPGFRMVLLLLHSPSKYGPVILMFFPLFLLPYRRDDTMLSSLA